MKRTTITKIDLDEFEAQWVLDMSYGMYTPAGDRRVGRAIVRLLKKGITHDASEDFGATLAYAVANALPTTEAGDSDVWDGIYWLGQRLFEGRVPEHVAKRRAYAAQI